MLGALTAIIKPIIIRYPAFSRRHKSIILVETSSLFHWFIFRTSHRWWSLVYNWIGKQFQFWLFTIRVSLREHHVYWGCNSVMVPRRTGGLNWQLDVSVGILWLHSRLLLKTIRVYWSKRRLVKPPVLFRTNTIWQQYWFHDTPGQFKHYIFLYKM